MTLDGPHAMVIGRMLDADRDGVSPARRMSQAPRKSAVKHRRRQLTLLRRTMYGRCVTDSDRKNEVMKNGRLSIAGLWSGQRVPPRS